MNITDLQAWHVGFSGHFYSENLSCFGSILVFSFGSYSHGSEVKTAREIGVSTDLQVSKLAGGENGVIVYGCVAVCEGYTGLNALDTIAQCLRGIRVEECGLGG